MNNIRPTVKECLSYIQTLTEEKEQLKVQLESEKRRVNEVFTNFAFHRSYELAPHDKSEIFFMSLNHIDSEGYHFSYGLREDNSKHAVCVKHTDLR